jgi:hypothetical protein
VSGHHLEVATPDPIAPLPGPGAVEHGAPQPGGRPIVVPEARPRQLQADERVLHDLLGGLTVAEQQAGQPDQRPVVGGEQRLQLIGGRAGSGTIATTTTTTT